MEITQVTNPNTVGPKSPELETETPIRIQPVKPLSSSNGVLKRHHLPHHHNHQRQPYKECLKNHAASLGGHALDGCGEFMASPSSNPSDPTSLKCDACGCHRNFHRREQDDILTHPQPQLPNMTTTIEYQPHHRHHPPPPQPVVPKSGHRSPDSASPPPISSSFYPSATNMLVALSGGVLGQQNAKNFTQSESPNARKRFRTKFTQTQKEKMHEFAERVGWKMQKRDEDLVQELCNEIGVDKGVLKVWMHNNKNTFSRRDVNGTPIINTLNNGVVSTSISTAGAAKNNNNGNENDANKLQGIEINRDHHQYETNVGTNASSSSS